jgi:hypothetical protein
MVTPGSVVERLVAIAHEKHHAVTAAAGLV